MIPRVRYGYLALIDILGFSDLIRADQGLKRIGEYLEKLDGLGSTRGVKFVAFSDSIILTADGDGEDSFLKIAATCSTLLLELLRVSIPIRGAITFGEYVRNDAGDARGAFVAGKAVLDAYHYEQLQDWVGIMIAPEALFRLDRDRIEAQCALPDIDRRRRLGPHINMGDVEDVEQRAQWAAAVQKCSVIPFHREQSSDPPTFDGFAIVPTSGGLQAETVLADIEEAVRNLHRLRALAPSPRVQRKHWNTIQWLNDKHLVWSELVRVKGEQSIKF